MIVAKHPCPKCLSPWSLVRVWMKAGFKGWACTNGRCKWTLVRMK